MNSLNSLRLKFNLVVLLSTLLCLVSHCECTLDLSNLDLKNFEYFRYMQILPNGLVRNVMAPPPSIHDHIDRTKAVAEYFRKLVLGNSAYDSEVVPFVFNPNVTPLRQRFQAKYGVRGIYLVESLGKGYVPSVA